MSNRDECQPFAVIDCPNCPNQGWFIRADSRGDPVQEQCQFCYCEPRSRFNIEAAARASIQPAEVKP